MALSPRARGSLSPLSVPVAARFLLHCRHRRRARAGGLPRSLSGALDPPVNAWWGSFDLAVSLFSGAPANPPSDDFIMRNAMDSQEVAVGWWPGDPRYPHAAFYAYAHPAPAAFAATALSPAAARWDAGLGEHILDWDDVVAAHDPHALALEFARSAFRQACLVCEWDPALAASADGLPPPVR
jgi:hypothetical protein